MDPDHSIIDRPWEYDIVAIRIETSIASSEEPHLDLVLRRDDVVRRLRFFSPQDIGIEKDLFLQATGGMQILDTRARQLEGLNVCVSDFEGHQGSITFWARDVINLDQTSEG